MSTTLEEAQAKSQNDPANALPGALLQNHPDAGVTIPVLATKTRPTPTLSPNGLSVAEYKRRQWFCEAADGVLLEDVMKPEFWAHVASKMTPFDRIEVVSVDGTWAADLMVIATGRTAAKVVSLHQYSFVGGYADMSRVNTTHEVKHRGPRRWSIIRIADSAVVKEDIATREDADRILADYLKALGM